MAALGSAPRVTGVSAMAEIYREGCMDMDHPNQDVQADALREETRKLQRPVQSHVERRWVKRVSFSEVMIIECFATMYARVNVRLGHRTDNFAIIQTILKDGTSASYNFYNHQPLVIGLLTL